MLQQRLNPNLFNIDLLILNNDNVQNLKEVKRGNIFEPNSQVFDKLGLFSTDIFGPVGSTTRSELPAYVDLKLGILHPLVYEHIISLKGLYGDIFTGKVKVKFNNTLKDFEAVKNDEEGETGYQYFIEHLDKIKFADSESDQRNYKLALIKKYGRTDTLITKWLVTPAGIRDYTVDDKNQPSEDEVNGIYRKLISAASLLDNIKLTDENITLLNQTRLKIQQITIEIYDYFKTLMDGKNKFIQGKWAKRAIRYGTRNVITPLPMHLPVLNSENGVSFNDTVIGIYQYAKGITPVTLNRIQNKFISKVVSPSTDTAKVVDVNTLLPVTATISVKKRDEWVSMDGLNNILNKLSQDELRDEPVMVDKYYMMLVYDDGKNVKILTTPDDHELHSDKKHVRPLTYVELVYISLYEVRHTFAGLLTRYPVTGLGGIYPTKFYVKTTTTGRTVNFTMDGETFEMVEYPALGEEYINSISPHITKLARLGADHDGDMVSVNIGMTDDTIVEIDKLLLDKSYYLTPEGEITFSVANAVLSLVLAHATDDL